jgi:hypothetical protein
MPETLDVRLLDSDFDFHSLAHFFRCCWTLDYIDGELPAKLDVVQC